MAKVQEIGPYSAYAIAVKYGYKGTEEEWVKEQEANRKAAEAAAAAAAQSAKDAAASASGVAQSGQQAVQGIKDAQTAAEQAIDTAKQQAVQAAQAEAEKAATSAGQAASSAAEAAQSATNAAAEVGKVQSAGTSAVQAVQAAQNTATEAVSAAQQTATQTVSEAQATAVSAVQEAGTTQTSAVASAASSALTNISGAKDAALSDVAEAGAAQVSAIGTTGADAVEDVNDAKTAALEAIDAASAALPSPTQSDVGKVPTVKADGSAYELAGPYAPLSAAIRPTASGNPVSITDSVEWTLLGLKVYGKSTQVTTTGAQLFDVSTTLDNTWITIDSGATVNTNGFWTSDYIPVQPGQYFSSAKGSSRTALYDAEKQFVRYFGYIGGSAFTIHEGEAYIRITGSNDFPPESVMFNVGSTALPWEPYTGGQASPSPNYPQKIVSAGDGGSIALTVSDGADQSQSLPLSTPNGLPGIPVDSGGNYTDESGQQWVCDEIDFARGVYVQRIGIYQPETNLTNITEGGVTDGQTIICRRNVFNGKNPYATVAMCNFISKKSLAIWTIDEECYNYANDGYLDFRILKSRLTEVTIQGVKDFCQSINATFLFALVNPIETPIPPKELAAYRALHTYNGTTVISTAENVAGLEVKYVADAQKYIDDRLTAAESHIQEIAAAQLNAQTGG